MTHYTDPETLIVAGCASIPEAVIALRRAGYPRTTKSVGYKWRLMHTVKPPHNVPKPLSLGMNVLFRLGN